jgi:hypothetical protein
MNLIINLRRKKLTRIKIEKMEKIIFPSCENTITTTKSKVFISKTKGLERSA